MTRISIESVSKYFSGPDGEITAVDDIDLEVEDGEFLVLVGPSGCGKSTTLRLLAGLETVDTGRIVADGETITEKRPRNRDIAMVFQNYALYPHKTVEENISYALEKRTSLGREQIDSKVTEVMELLDIPELRNKKPSQLSGGQKQRVSLGRAIVREPEIFLMDEPLSNLDAKLRMQMRTEIQRIHGRFGVTTIYVTHDQEEAMSMSDKIAVMRDGEIQQVATPGTVYDYPANRFVAEFIGSPSMNFFNASLQNQAITGDGLEMELSEGQDIESGAYVVGIRPEDIEIEHSDPDTEEATVNVVEPVGDESIVYLTLSEKEVKMKIPRSETPAVGDTVFLRMPESGLHFFDADSGDAVGFGQSNEIVSTDALSLRE